MRSAVHRPLGGTPRRTITNANPSSTSMAVIGSETIKFISEIQHLIKTQIDTLCFDLLTVEVTKNIKFSDLPAGSCSLLLIIAGQNSGRGSGFMRPPH